MSSSKERQAKRRKLLKENRELYEAYLEKDKKRKAESRAAKRSTMSQSDVEEHKLQERIRLRKYRERKRSESQQCSSSPQATGTPYRSTQALGKAVKRVQLSLPSSPRKKRCVIQNLAKRVGIEVLEELPLPHRSNGLSESTKMLVNNFYLSDDISWQAPGRKDRVIIREVNEGRKEKRTEQARYMLTSLKEAHFKFLEDHPSDKIGLSKFCELRPSNVKLFDHIPHHVCVCSYHENVRLLLAALKEHTSLQTEFQDFICQMTCDAQAEACLTGQCKSCEKNINSFKPINGGNALRYFQWQSINKRNEKVEIIGTVDDAFKSLSRQLKPFLLHTYVKRKQAAVFSKLVSSCDGESIVLQVDFSENATIASQREIQSAHWNHSQATIFTAHIWIDTKSDTKSKEGIVIVSDDLDHSKQSVYTYMQYILNRLKVKCPNMKVLDVFSDGAGSQFKQKYLFSNLHSWEKEHDFNIHLEFFCHLPWKGSCRWHWRDCKKGSMEIC